MDLETRVTIHISDVPPKMFSGMLPEIERNIKYLEKLPPLKVLIGFRELEKKRHINYKAGEEKDWNLEYGKGYRTIYVTSEIGRSPEEILIRYTVRDHAHIIGTNNPHTIVSNNDYIQRKGKKLRKLRKNNVKPSN